MKCYIHNEIDSVGVCTRCGKSVCNQCSIELDHKLVCKTCAEGMLRSSQVPPQPRPVAPPQPAYAGVTVVRHKEPLLALILSLLFPGLGQIYNGQVLKGVLIFVAYTGLWIISGFLMVVLIGFCTMVLPIVIWLYAMFNAYSVAERINRGERV